MYCSKGALVTWSITEIYLLLQIKLFSLQFPPNHPYTPGLIHQLINTLSLWFSGGVYQSRESLKCTALPQEQHRESLRTEMEQGLAIRPDLNPLHTKLTSNVISTEMPEEIAILLREKKINSGYENKY